MLNLFFVFLAPDFCFSLEIILEQVKGRVEVASKAAPASWQPARPGMVLKIGDRVRTARAKASIRFGPDRVVELGPSSALMIDLLTEEKSGVKLVGGKLKAFWKQLVGLKTDFQVVTSVGVAAVRGTEFGVGFDHENKAMDVEVYLGSVDVATLRGEAVTLEEGQRLVVLEDAPLQDPQMIDGRISGSVRLETQREVALGMNREQVQAAAAYEARLAEYQEGKTMLDAFGVRVRLEEYITRPAGNQFKFVVLNERQSRFDYFYYLGTFNKSLPADLSVALKEIDGRTGSAPEYYQTAYESVRSNTQDSIQENATGGHLVEQTLTEDEVLYHPDADTFETISAGSKLWKTLFDDYSYKVNGTEKFGWAPLSGSNIQAYDYDSFKTRILNTTTIEKGGALCATAATCLSVEEQLRQAAITRPDGSDTFHDRLVIAYRTSIGGAIEFSETYDFYVVDDNGNLAKDADFSGNTSGKEYLETLLKWNYQQAITASVFGGRKIDLVVEPKILMKAGLIQ